MKILVSFFSFFLVIQGIYAMDLKPYNPTDEQCMTVALYLNLPHHRAKREMFEQCNAANFRNPLAMQKAKNFLVTIDADTEKAVGFLNSIPILKMADLLSKTELVDKNTKLIASILSQSNMFVFVTYNQDVLSVMFNASLPTSFEDKAGFFSEKSNNQVQIINPDNAPSYPVLSKVDMIQKLHEMPLEKVLYALCYVEIPTSKPSMRRCERVVPDSSCLKAVDYRSMPPMDYHWTYEDCKNLTPLQMVSLDAIQESENVYWENDTGVVITDDMINILNAKPVKDFILKNEKYGKAPIKVDITPSTTRESILNKLLYYVPHALVMIVPDLVQSHMSGMFDRVMGVSLCAVGSFEFGEYIYPRIDSYNSDVYKLSEWFGADNHRRKRAGKDFIFICVIHSIVSLIAQKCLSQQAIPLKLLGGCIYAARALLSGFTLINLESFTNDDPFRRRNKEGVPFTLEDLAKGPKFNS